MKRSLEGQALAIHACHEADLAVTVACALRLRELATWIQTREVTAPAKP